MAAPLRQSAEAGLFISYFFTAFGSIAICGQNRTDGGGTRNRTQVSGFGDRCPTIERCPLRTQILRCWGQKIKTPLGRSGAFLVVFLLTGNLGFCVFCAFATPLTEL